MTRFALRAVVLLGLSMLALAACAASDGALYAPPAKSGGRLCILQCDQARVYCDRACDLDFRACYADMQNAANQAYMLYAQQRRDSGVPNDRFPSAFENRQRCDPARNSCDAACVQSYDSCYTACGGTVTPP